MAVLCVAVLVGGLPSLLFAASFTAGLERDTINLGESTTLSLTFAGGSPRSAPAAPAVPNLQIDYVGPSSQFSMINGQVTSSVTHNYSVTARQPGTYTIPALTAEFGQERLSTQPLTLKVLKPGAPTAGAINSGTQLAFLKLTLPKKEIYLGETLVAQVQVFLHNKVQNIEQFQLAAIPAEGFNVGKMVEDRQRYQTQIGNVVYQVINLSFPIKAVKTGPLTFGPVTANTVVSVASTARRRDPMFEQFGFRGFFDGFGSEQKQLALASESEALQCLPLPSVNVPTNFNGAVGSFTLNASAGPTNVAVGDPITVKVQISGRGSLDSLTLPEQSAWKDFKAYPPTAKLDTGDPLGLQGSKTFEQVITPQSADIKALPPVAFSFFDPDQKRYVMLSQAAVPLTVRPAGSASTPVILAANRPAQDNSAPTQDIVEIKQHLGAVAQIGPPLVLRPWFLAVQGIPVLAFVLAVGWRKRNEMLANNPRLRRRRQVAQLIREGLSELQQLANQNKSDEFFAALVRLLQEQLGERLDLPASAITEAVIEERLRPRGVPEATLTALQELFQSNNLARYAPIKSSQELAAFIPQLEAALRQLQEMPV